MPVTCQWTAPAAPRYPGARDWGRSPSAPRPASRTCGHVRRAPASAPKLGFPRPRPQPPASRAGPGQRPPSEEGRGLYSREEAGRRERGDRTPSPGAPSWSRHRPAAVRPGGSGPTSPPAGRPAGSESPPAPRARPGVRANARDPGSSAPAPLLCGPRGAAPVPPAARLLLGASAAGRPFPSAAAPLSAARAGPSASQRGLRSRPPTRPGCLPSAAVTAAQPSALLPGPLPLNNSLHAPERRRRLRRREPGCEVAAAVPGRKGGRRGALPGRRLPRALGGEEVETGGGGGDGGEEAGPEGASTLPGARRRPSWAAPGRTPGSHARFGAGSSGTGGVGSPRPPLGGSPRGAVAAAWVAAFALWSPAENRGA